MLLACGFGLDVSAGVRLLALASILVNVLVVWRAVLLVRLVRRQRDELAALARTDGLTGIANRRSWDFEIARRAADAGAADQPVAVAILDLDHFKRFNDEQGHQSGDRLLVACAAAWTDALPADAYLARYGGEEFAVLLPTSDLASAVEVLERVRIATPPPVTVSIGVAVLDPALPVHVSVSSADDALYRAKAKGRDQVVADRRTASV
ncbi:MAG: GGDEF domain-containing protein [Actinobacteria bacterium]|nr:GGDEF domain-containing protein [Actinomycetota bacterium]